MQSNATRVFGSTLLALFILLVSAGASADEVTFEDFVLTQYNDSEVYSSTSPAILEYGHALVKCETPIVEDIVQQLYEIVMPATAILLPATSSHPETRMAKDKLRTGCIYLQRCRVADVRQIAAQAVGRRDMPRTIREWGIERLINLGRIVDTENSTKYASELRKFARFTFNEDHEMRWYMIRIALGMGYKKPVEEWLPPLEPQVFTELLKQELLEYRFTDAGDRMMAIILYLVRTDEDAEARELFRAELDKYLEDAAAGADYTGHNIVEQAEATGFGLD